MSGCQEGSKLESQACIHVRVCGLLGSLTRHAAFPAVPPSIGLFYPFISALADRFGGLVVQPEHRFYGASQPLGNAATWPGTAHLPLLRPQQALADAVALVRAVQTERGCDGTIDGKARCPVVAVGGPYPGCLSFFARLRYPAVFDAAYAASAPLKFFSGETSQYAYYDLVTGVAARFQGCDKSLRAALEATLSEAAGKSEAELVKSLQLCAPLPAYVQGNVDLLREELGMVVMYTFATLSMGNYPPGDSTAFESACDAVNKQQASGDSFGALRAVLLSWVAKLGAATAAMDASATADACFNMSAQLPAGANSTISSGDWTGVGTGSDGANWDWQTCTLMVDPAATSERSMFLPRPWSTEWLRRHCASRFGVAPQPSLLADMWGFDSRTLQRMATSGQLTNVIFTNGLLDGWSAGGYQANLSDTVVAFNLPNGAHHSDLSHKAPGSGDTPDVLATRRSVATLLQDWLLAEHLVVIQK